MVSIDCSAIKRDNCKDCKSHCEHAGKDREFICRGGISCKVTRSTFIVCPEGCNWSEVDATTAEMAYCGVCSWYSPKTRIAVIDRANGHTAVFTRELDSAGNLVKINIERL